MIARQFVDEGEDSLQYAVIMIAALVVKPDAERIAQLAGYPQEFVDQVAARLNESGLWKNDFTDYQEWDHRTLLGRIRFVQDLLVAKGKLFRTGEKRRGQYVYVASAVICRAAQHA